ncbi:adenylate/guanylate cyclase domain-containing protein [[Mycobacterium] wendilense]|uniref:Adenylate/guanylate cyclase domain-containing protein n=1 Tax=[Mycobacterium] wendilense TaxID=3064284 RepID=A0ABM9MI42_9MYCO|nr:adenylate/guanylate cyclase domain-containing protein [Mycolicibacterium sp. MU0050]CAJ1585747.1 adenylate/guanylate cyclase domain-containing protein [Mycolicibacterium sp. MU0050]
MDVVVVSAVGVVALSAIVTLTVLLIVSRRQLGSARAEIERLREEQGRRRRRLGVAPLAIKTVWQTADSLLSKGIGATVRNSIEDLAGWAQVERPDLARLTADGDVVIAFSDIEGSTELNEALGDREWIKVLERHNRLVVKLVGEHGGHVVKNQGDGFMIAFGAATQAVLCSIGIQRALEERIDRRRAIRVRIGIHLGSSVRRGDDLFGRNVAIAARVADQAAGGEVLVTEAVRAAVEDTADAEADIEFGPPREVDLKGIRGAYQLFPVCVPLGAGR